MGSRATTGRSGALTRKVILLVLGFSLLMATGANASATDLFIKFDGIDGGSTESHHPKWSEILSVDWGVSATGSSSGSGQSAGKAVLNDLLWTQVMDKSIPPLFDKILAGSHISTVNIDFATTSGASEQIYFQMEFKNVVLTSLDLSGATGSDTKISGAFDYDSIKMTYTDYGPTGSIIGTVTGSYDLSAKTGSVAGLTALYGLGLAGPGQPLAVPVPASLLLVGSGLAGLAGLRRKFSR